MLSPKEVVILGAGVFGTLLAHKLASTLPRDDSPIHITLINARDHFVYLPVNLRNSVQDISSTYIKPLDPVFAPNPSVGKVKVGEAVSVDGERKVVVLRGGEEVRYDILVLALGSSWSDPNLMPAKHEELLNYFSKQRAAIKKAKHITIVGGGAVGVEFAGEIADLYPPSSGKHVTLVHSEGLPLSKLYRAKFRTEVKNKLEKLGVEVVLYAKGTKNEDGTVTIAPRDGREPYTLRSDLIYSALTPTPNTRIFPDEWKDEKGYIRVTPTFQLESDSSVMAIGDLTNVKEVKQAAKAPGTIAVAAPNIVSLAKGQEPLKTYGGATEMIALAMGKKTGTGVAQMPFFGQVIFPSWFVVKIKCGDLFAGRITKDLGLK
ncbi:uncharacterized protein V1513DRAFT_456032 [Lipomyces chichibuensis]|uniref:uncharacterized protein n=1 Tax=Lipomyces chichibuensis TaxID=1546026 RepID=UPI0033431279